MISETIDRLLSGDALSAGDTEAAVGLVMRGEADPAQIAGLLASKNAEVARAATHLIDQLGITTDDAVFAGWVADEAQPAPPGSSPRC